MEFTHGLLIITIVHLLAAASPGPDFVMVTQQTLSHGRKTGLLVSVGIALGLSVHILYSSLGLAALIAGSASLLMGVKILGGSYLLYLGVKGLRARPRKPGTPQEGLSGHPASSDLKTIGMGFLCNALNPKAPIYFVSLFTVVLSPDLPAYLLAIYGIWLMFLQLAWFSLVATVLASPPVSARVNRFAHYIDRVFGGAMILLGLKVLATRTN